MGHFKAGQRLLDNHILVNTRNYYLTFASILAKVKILAEDPARDNEKKCHITCRHILFPLIWHTLTYFDNKKTFHITERCVVSAD